MLRSKLVPEMSNTALVATVMTLEGRAPVRMTLLPLLMVTLPEWVLYPERVVTPLWAKMMLPEFLITPLMVKSLAAAPRATSKVSVTLELMVFSGLLMVDPAAELVIYQVQLPALPEEPTRNSPPDEFGLGPGSMVPSTIFKLVL